MIAIGNCGVDVKFIFSCGILVMPIALLLGCGATQQVVPPPPPPPTPSFAVGNWNFQMYPQATAGVYLALGGALTESGSQVTGMLYVIPTPLTTANATSYTTCYNLLDTLSLTGSINDKGNLQLVSSTYNNQVITLSGTVGGASTTDFLGTYNIAAGDPTQAACAGSVNGSFQASLMQPISGTYSGSFTPFLPDSSTPSPDPPIPAVAQLMQSAEPDATGAYHLTGSLQATGWNCFDTGNVVTAGDFTGNASTFIAGNFALISFAANSPSDAVISTNTFLSDNPNALTLALFVIPSGTCSGTGGTALLSQ